MSTPLTFACMSGNTVIVKMLISRGANVSYQDEVREGMVLLLPCLPHPQAFYLTTHLANYQKKNYVNNTGAAQGFEKWHSKCGNSITTIYNTCNNNQNQEVIVSLYSTS